MKTKEEIEKKLEELINKRTLEKDKQSEPWYYEQSIKIETLMWVITDSEQG